jgi:hypothetical protein
MEMVRIPQRWLQRHRNVPRVHTTDPPGVLRRRKSDDFHAMLNGRSQRGR